MKCQYCGSEEATQLDGVEGLGGRWCCFECLLRHLRSAQENYRGSIKLIATRVKELGEAYAEIERLEEKQRETNAELIQCKADLLHAQSFYYNPVGFLCFHAQRGDRVSGLCSNLVELVAHLQQRDRGYTPDYFDIYAVFEPMNGEQLRIPIPPEFYSKKMEVAREEALEFIQDRQKRIEEAEALYGKGSNRATFPRFCGIMRCDPDDPIEDQVSEYIETAPPEWLSKEELTQRQKEVFRYLEYVEQEKAICSNILERVQCEETSFRSEDED